MSAIPDAILLPVPAATPNWLEALNIVALANEINASLPIRSITTQETNALHDAWLSELSDTPIIPGMS